jgi:hypothetical protein
MSKARISARAGRVIVWILAVLAAGFLFNAQQNQQDQADKDRTAIRILIEHNKQVSEQSKKDNTIITAALCTYIDDLVRRQGRAAKLLKEHPDGLPGITTAQALKTSIDAQQHAIDALNSINCTAKK